MNKYKIFLLSLCLSCCTVFAIEDDRDDDAALFADYTEDEQRVLFEMWQRQTFLRRRAREAALVVQDQQLDDAGAYDRENRD